MKTNKKEPKVISHIDMSKEKLNLNNKYMELNDIVTRQCLQIDFEERSKGCQYLNIKHDKIDKKPHLDLSKKKIVSLAMETTDFEVKDFSKLTKREKRRHLRQVHRANAKTALFDKEYLRYIYLMLKSII